MHLLDNESTGHGLRPAAFAKASPVPKIVADHGLPPPSMDHLDELEAQSIYILREAFARLKKLALLWSLGKDSNVMIWLARQDFRHGRCFAQGCWPHPVTAGFIVEKMHLCALDLGVEKF